MDFVKACIVQGARANPSLASQFPYSGACYFGIPRSQPWDILKPCAGHRLLHDIYQVMSLSRMRLPRLRGALLRALRACVLISEAWPVQIPRLHAQHARLGRGIVPHVSGAVARNGHSPSRCETAGPRARSKPLLHTPRCERSIALQSLRGGGERAALVSPPRGGVWTSAAPGGCDDLGAGASVDGRGCPLGKAQ